VDCECAGRPGHGTPLGDGRPRVPGLTEGGDEEGQVDAGRREEEGAAHAGQADADVGHPAAARRRSASRSIAA
jgi:hypothetical protein